MLLASLIAWSLWQPTFAQEMVTPQPTIIDSPAGTGELTVSVENSEIFGSVPRGARRVKMLSLYVSASCESDITIENIDVKHVGLGERSDITGVYIGDTARRLSRPVSLSDRNRTAHLRLQHFTIKKCDGTRLF